MTAQYDAIATDYQRTKTTPLRRHVEAWSFDRMLGDVSGLRVLDLACGEGFYTRRLAQAGAATAVGVDVSAEMIRLARDIETTESLGIEYHCADVAALPELGKFDLVTAAYLLHYAPDVSALEKMCRNIVDRLQPGGRFVAINENPDQPAEAYAGYSQYGFNKSVEQPRTDGSPIHYTLISGRQLIHFDAYYYSRATYESVLHQSGFQSVRWVPLELSPAGPAELGEEYWREYLSNPPVCGLVCE